jgi:hypothetical protein
MRIWAYRSKSKCAFDLVRWTALTAPGTVRLEGNGTHPAHAVNNPQGTLWRSQVSAIFGSGRSAPGLLPFVPAARRHRGATPDPSRDVAERVLHKPFVFAYANAGASDVACG